MPFAVEAVAHDLGALVQHAWEAKAFNCQRLLQRFLHFDQHGSPVLAGVKKAQAILASYFLHTGQTEPAALIRESFRGREPAFIQTLKEELLQVTRQKYWEVSERRMNIDFIPVQQREKLEEFFNSLLKGQEG